MNHFFKNTKFCDFLNYYLLIYLLPTVKENKSDLQSYTSLNPLWKGPKALWTRRQLLLSGFSDAKNQLR